MPDGLPDTAPDPAQTSLKRHRRGAWGRRLTALVVVGFLVAGMLGVWGVRKDELVAVGEDGVELRVRYARTARPGLSIPLSLQVTNPRGWNDGETVRLSITSAYLEMMRVSQLSPEPSRTTADGKRTFWEIETPRGDTLSLAFDAQVDSAENPGRKRATIAVVEEGGPSLVRTSILTWVLP